jgi:hypothetical protein
MAPHNKGLHKQLQRIHPFIKQQNVTHTSLSLSNLFSVIRLFCLQPIVLGIIFMNLTQGMLTVESSIFIAIILISNSEYFMHTHGSTGIPQTTILNRSQETQESLERSFQIEELV